MTVKKMSVATMICGLTLSAVAASCWSRTPEQIAPVPNVAYTYPEDESTVDLTGKESLEFRWKSVPIPGGGRSEYRFRLFKGFAYGAIVKKELSRDEFSTSVPSDVFADGATYTWYVRQRDGRNMGWSMYDTWVFKVVKRSK